MAGTGARRTRWAWLVGTFFGAGFLRPGPGTYASIVVALLWWAATHVFHPDGMVLMAATAGAAAVATVVGIPAATIVAREVGREDPGFVVIDEVAGQLVALLAMRPDWKHAVIAVLLFRLFDIWKPWPVGRLEELPAGTGIMLDDVAAGVIALAAGVVISFRY